MCASTVNARSARPKKDSRVEYIYCYSLDPELPALEWYIARIATAQGTSGTEIVLSSSTLAQSSFLFFVSGLDEVLELVFRVLKV